MASHHHYTPNYPADSVTDPTPLSLADARRLVGTYVNHYNTVRLHSAIGYVAPQDKLEGRVTAIFAERDRKLAETRERRKTQRAAARKTA